MRITVNSEDYAAWVHCIDNEPKNFTLRLVFADWIDDWLDDSDDGRSAGWRFTADRKLVPMRSWDFDTHYWMSTETGASAGGELRGRLWRLVYARSPFRECPRAELPVESVNQFHDRCRYWYSEPSNRISAFKALDAVVRAYTSLTPAERRYV